MKIAASSCCWWHNSLREALGKAQAAGFTAFEPLTFPAEIFRLHGDLRELDVGDLRAMLETYGMELAALHLGAIMTSSEEKRRALTDYAKRAIEVAVELGCTTIVEGGPDRATEPFVPFLRSLEELVPVLEGTDVRIALENHYGNWIQYTQDYEHIFEHVDHPQIGITLDTGHFTSAGVDPEDVVRRFPDKVLHVHVKDHVGTHSVALGSGETNNLGVASALREIGYQGYLTQELELENPEERDQAARDGLEYMKRLCAA